MLKLAATLFALMISASVVHAQVVVETPELDARLNAAIAATKARCATTTCNKVVADAETYVRADKDFCGKANDIPRLEADVGVMVRDNHSMAARAVTMLEMYKDQVKRLCTNDRPVIKAEVIAKLQNIKN